MCKVIEDMLRQERAEGRAEGVTLGQTQTVLLMQAIIAGKTDAEITAAYPDTKPALLQTIRTALSVPRS